jgi:long-chain acyl-CoA synthetase
MADIAAHDGVDPGSVIEDALRESTLCGAFQLTAAANAARPALRAFGGDLELTWGDYADRVRSVATGLAALGVQPGDAIGLLLGNRPEFFLVDTAAQHVRGVPFSIYPTSPPEQIVPLIENSGARVVVTERAHLDKVRAVAARTDRLEQIVVVEDDADGAEMRLAELESLSPDGFDFESAWRDVGPDDLIGLVYTSGTTGNPKGVEWTHAGMLANLLSLHGLAPVSPEGRVVAYLPMAHLAERFISHWASMPFGYTITTVADPTQLGSALAEARPTRFFSVPRLYDKFAAAAQKLAATDTVLSSALDAALAAVRAGRHDAAADPALEPIRAALGLDASEWRGSGASPSRPDVLELFTALGLPIVEFWGMSEVGFAVSNPPQAPKIRTVGLPLPGVEAKLEADGELLIRGPIFRGYRNDPKATEQAVDREGWMKTGDVATVDEDGYYTIVDRKKEILINSAGKNIAPAMVELSIKPQSPVVGHVVALGDNRPYVTALIVPDEDGLRDFAARNGLEGSFAELAMSEVVRAELEHAIEAGNQLLARSEQVKTFGVVETPWLPGGDEVTMTMKLRRRIIDEKYADRIEALYAARA